MDSEINCRIDKASGTFSRLSGRAWVKFKYTVYRACICSSTLLYGSETWTLSTMQQKKINIFHQRCLSRILRVRWQHKITTKKYWDVLVLPLCTPPSASAGFAGFVMFWEWATSASQRLCYTLSWLSANVASVYQDYVTKTFANATWRALKMLKLMSWKGLRMYATDGALLWLIDYVKGKTNFLKYQRRRRRNQNEFTY